MPGNKKNRRKEIQKIKRAKRGRSADRTPKQVISIEPPTGGLAMAALAAFAIATKGR